MRIRTCLLIGLLALAAPVAAQSPAPGSAQEEAAKEHFKRGEAAYQKGSYDLAISEWQAAYDADPRPRIQYNLYQAYERLGQLIKASDALQKYLSTADPDDPNYSDATARMSALQQRLQATGIRLVGGVDGAAINISGHDWGLLPRPDRIPVQPGNHRVVVTLQGYQDFTANVVVPAGQVVDVPITMEPAASAAPQPATAPAASTMPAAGTPPTAAEAQGGSNATPFFITAAVLGAGAIGSAVWAVNRASALSGCNDPAMFCTEEDTVKTQRNIAFGVTAALGAGAIGLLIYGLVAGGGDQNEQAALCLPDALGGHCQLRF